MHRWLTNRTLRKVPEITIYFWIIKILTTALGESTSDYLVHHIDPVMAVVLGFIGFAIAMLLQFMVHRYIPWVYWFTVTMVALFGTMAADVVHIVLKVPYAISTGFFAVLLAIIFIIWHKVEQTLSIHSIHTPRRELFYWIAVIATFALGTAAGDWTAITLKLGFLTSGVVFALLFAIPAIAYWKFRLNGIIAFWFAYIMTRPFGASFADLLGKAREAGGLEYGNGVVSAVLFILIVGLVSYLAVTRKDSQGDPS
jgi:uncharacterized membrane-anchored protein